MQHYKIKEYQQGFEKDQARIGMKVAQNWIWPYAYGYNDLIAIHSRPDFDPDTRHYCFIHDEMVGYMFSLITDTEDDALPYATLDFPRMMPGHEAAAELLIEQAFNTLKSKGITRVTGRVTTMCPGDIRLAEKCGFTINDWGYKVYYSYEMGWSTLHSTGHKAMEIDPAIDLDEISKIASTWYNHPSDWCCAHLKAWHEEGIIAHVGVRKQGKWIASCMAAANEIRPSTAALYYIVTPDSESLSSMLVKVVNKCVDFGAQNLIADLVNEHRQFESVYQNMGFKKVADWAHCQIHLS